MKVSELIAALQKLPQDLPVGSVGHYGELDRELYGVRVLEGRRTSFHANKITFVELEGMPPSYEEPD